MSPRRFALIRAGRDHRRAEDLVEQLLPQLVQREQHRRGLDAVHRRRGHQLGSPKAVRPVMIAALTVTRRRLPTGSAAILSPSRRNGSSSVMSASENSLATVGHLEQRDPEQRPIRARGELAP